MKKLLTASVLVIGTVYSAYAADLRPAYKSPPPAPPPPPTFTGCYVNGGAGYGLWNIDHNFNSFGIGGFGSSVQTTSGGRGWLGTVGGGCDYQFSPGSGFWSNWVVGVFADYDFMDIHRNLDEAGFSGEEKESSAWAVGGRIGYLVTPNVFTYWNGGYTQSQFDGVNSSFSTAPIGVPFSTVGSHTYSGWFIGGGTEIALSGLFGLPLPSGLFWRSEYRYSSFDSANLAVIGVPPTFANIQIGTENLKPYVQTITTSLVWKFNWYGR